MNRSELKQLGAPERNNNDKKIDPFLLPYTSDKTAEKTESRENGEKGETQGGYRDKCV